MIQFTPFKIEITTETQFASLVGALLAYGTDNLAENALAGVPIGDGETLASYYSGNVRKDARNAANKILQAIGLEEIDWSDVEVRKTGRRSKAGSLVPEDENNAIGVTSSTSYGHDAEFEIEEPEVAPLVVTL